MLHAHATIWKERGLLSGEKTPTKHQKEIVQLLQVIEMPKKVTVIHWHHRIGLADKEAKQVALRPYPSALPLFPSPPSLPINYSPEEENNVAQRGGTKQGDH
jgi:hypothetical protein